MENFISGQYVSYESNTFGDERLAVGYPGCEFQIRDALAEVVGKEKSELFFDKVSPLRFVPSHLTVYNPFP